jgi:hypothetical protein
MVIGGILGDQHDASDRAHGVGVVLERRVPEILRIAVRADCKADVGRMCIAREGEREPITRLCRLAAAPRSNARISDVLIAASARRLRPPPQRCSRMMKDSPSWRSRKRCVARPKRSESSPAPSFSLGERD